MILDINVEELRIVADKAKVEGDRTGDQLHALIDAYEEQEASETTVVELRETFDEFRGDLSCDVDDVVQSLDDQQDSIGDIGDALEHEPGDAAEEARDLLKRMTIRLKEIADACRAVRKRLETAP